MENLIDSVSAVCDMKTCNKCGETKELSKFPYKWNKNKTKKLPKNPCYDCKNRLQRETYLKIKEEHIPSKAYPSLSEEEKKEKSKKQYEASREDIQRTLWKNAKDRVKEADKDGKKPPPFTIVPSDIIVNNYCPQLGIPLVMNRGIPKDDSYSLDKIIPSKGYVPGNIQVVSNLFNRLKSDAENEQQLKDLHKFYKNNGFLKG